MANEVKPGKFKGGTALVLRHVGAYGAVNETWAKLSTLAAERGLTGPETQAIGLSYDDPTVTPVEKIRYDACLIIGDEKVKNLRFEGEEDQFTGVRLQKLQARGAKSTVHKGTYVTINESYRQLTGERGAAGAKARKGPFVEVYRNNPFNTPPEQLETEIYADEE